MNVDSAKRVVALVRQKKSYVALAKNGELTREEADAMIAMCDAEIALIRGQRDLALLPPGGSPGKGAK